MPEMSSADANSDAYFGAPLAPLVAVVVGTTQGHVALYQRASDDARPSQTLTLPEWQSQEELTLLQWVVLRPSEVCVRNCRLTIVVIESLTRMCFIYNIVYVFGCVPL